MAERNAVERPRWLRVLHRIGYVTTVLVAAELILIGFFAARIWLQDREMRASIIEGNRTHDGPVRPSGRDIVSQSAAYLLGQLPALSTLHGDGLRFVAMPSFNKAHFAISISMPSPTAREAEGVLSRFDQQNHYALLGQRPFRIPAPAYRSLVAKLDKLTDGWPGSSGLCVDGTAVAFERVRGTRVTSGVGGCGAHYDDLALLMSKYLRRFAPASDMPKAGDWEPDRAS